MAQDNRGGSAENNPGNFANDPERAREAGRKGGQSKGKNNENDR